MFAAGENYVVQDIILPVKNLTLPAIKTSVRMHDCYGGVGSSLFSHHQAGIKAIK
jgi:hypothetical protein